MKLIRGLNAIIGMTACVLGCALDTPEHWTERFIALVFCLVWLITAGLIAQRRG